MSEAIELPRIITSTMLDALWRCPRKFFFEHVLTRGTGRPNVDLHAGAAFAAGLEAARLGKDGAAALREAWGDPALFAGEVKNLDRMLGVLEFALTEAWPIEDEAEMWAGAKVEPLLQAPLDMLLVRHPSGEPFVFVGRPDAVVQYAGEWWTLDDKTTGRWFGKHWAAQWARRGQFTGYAWLCQQVLGIEVAGHITRGVSITKTRFDHNEAMSPRPGWMVEEWLRQIEFRLLDMLSSYDACMPGFWSSEGKIMEKPLSFEEWQASLGESCTDYARPCDFFEACTSERTLEVVEGMPISRYDPITRVRDGGGQGQG